MALTREERDELVHRYWESERKTTAPYLRQLSVNESRREYALQRKLLAAYGEGLPAVPVSRCPVCGEVLQYAFDAFGLDGMWWNKDGIVPVRRPAEPHHAVVLGAVDFHGREPAEAEPNGQVLPGPGVPFVVPRLLSLPGMSAVISSCGMPKGDTAYVIAYFSEAPVDPLQLHQPWAREGFSVGEDTGDATWGAASDVWDFDLRPWIADGRGKWIDPGDASLTLRESGPCPYVGLPGAREPQMIDMGRLTALPLPDGQPIDPFE
jgi:hypothetical protein